MSAPSASNCECKWTLITFRGTIGNRHIANNPKHLRVGMFGRIICVSIATACVASFAVAKERDYRAPRLPDGHPNLQGMWELTNLMPMERSRDMGTLIISQAEAAKLDNDAARRQEDPSVIDSASGYRRPRHMEPIRGELHSSVVIDPPNGRIPFSSGYTEKRRVPRPAGMATAYDGPEQRPTMERCIASDGAPLFRSIPSNNLHQFVQTADILIIHSEELPDTRIVRIGGHHAPSSLLSYLGDSIGWWEGDTLVVETTNFLPASYVSPKTRVIERFTRVSANELDYLFTVEDPDYYTQKWTGENHFMLGDERMFEYACHEGNYALPNILRGARVQDKSSSAASSTASSE
jgi:hypothetical protein